MVLAAQGRPLLEFGTRRTHHEAAPNAARSAYLAGFSATSNVRASERFGIPNAGTMSHMWVMLNEDEDEAFAEFAATYKNPTLLIDTYDTIEGAKKATKIRGLGAVRLDSGDFDYLSKEVRNILDKAGHTAAKIIVSGDMNEYKINELIQAGAPIDMFGIGTELVTPKDVHSLGAVYKAVYDNTNNRPVIKLAAGKTTLPGVKQVYLVQEDSGWHHLVSLDGQLEQAPNMSPLLDCHIKKGNVCDESVVDLEVSRQYCNAALLNLPSHLASLELSDSDSVPVQPHDNLKQLFKEAYEKIGK
jgi:nicotinate phosphoribosyltransferase